jgi:hypothetical protein
LHVEFSNHVVNMQLYNAHGIEPRSSQKITVRFYDTNDELSNLAETLAQQREPLFKSGKTVHVHKWMLAKIGRSADAKRLALEKKCFEWSVMHLRNAFVAKPSLVMIENHNLTFGLVPADEISELFAKIKRCDYVEMCVFMYGDLRASQIGSITRT